MLSLKQIGTICLSILIPTFSVFATPDIASNSNGNGSCVEPVLHRYDGSANLQAGWQANTIQLKWYNGDTQLDVQDAADSCTYDGALTLPETQPTKTGYTFAGWRVKTVSATPSEPEAEPEPSGGLCGLTSSGVNSAVISEDATHTRWKPLNGSDGYTMEEEFGTENSTGLNNGEWELIDSNGNKYRGIASCNSTTGSNLGEDTSPSGTMSSSDTGLYCWCHAESYTPNGVAQCSLSSLAWVFDFDARGSASFCANYCAYYCAYHAQDNSAFRAAVFGVAGN